MEETSRTAETLRMDEAPRNLERKRLFIRGAVAAMKYYLGAAALAALLIRSGGGLGAFVGVIPCAVLLGAAWGLVSLALWAKPWFRGALLVHVLVLIPFLYLAWNYSPLQGDSEPEEVSSDL